MFGASKFSNIPGVSGPGFNDVGGIISAAAPVVGTLIGGPVGGAIGGALGSAFSGNQAAKAQVQSAQQAAAVQQQAADQATALQRQIYQQTVARQQPWLSAGQNALAQMVQGTAGPNSAYMKPFSMADYQADPGYSFRMSEGMKALEQGAAARGGLLSGNMLRGAQQYGQNLASQEYQNAYDRYQQQKANQFNRLASMAGVGQTAVGALGSAGQNYAGNVGNIRMDTAGNVGNALLASGQARASSIAGTNKAIGQIYGFGGNQNIGTPSFNPWG